MSTQIEVKEPIKLLNKDGSLTQPGWAKRNIIDNIVLELTKGVIYKIKELCQIYYI